MSNKGRVLVVDDEVNARNALAELLRDEGYHTEVAADGAQALRMLESSEPDVVLTDLKMPVMDGLTLLEQGRPLAPHAAFVVMTAFGSIDTAVQAIQRGAENYLTKPLDLGEGPEIHAFDVSTHHGQHHSRVCRAAGDRERARVGGRAGVDPGARLAHGQ